MTFVTSLMPIRTLCIAMIYAVHAGIPALQPSCIVACRVLLECTCDGGDLCISDAIDTGSTGADMYFEF